MSVYFDKHKEMYVVRSYEKGLYKYVGRYLLEEDANIADAQAKQRLKEERKNGPKFHSKEWFAETSKRQIVELSAKFKELHK
jgi:hypothetical protein